MANKNLDEPVVALPGPPLDWDAAPAGGGVYDSITVASLLDLDSVKDSQPTGGRTTTLYLPYHVANGQRPRYLPLLQSPSAPKRIGPL